MHSQHIGEHSFHHNGDYSGDVIINASAGDLAYEYHDNSGNPFGDPYEAIKIPFEVLAEFVGEAVRDAREGRLEQLEWYEVLGLRGKE